VFEIVWAKAASPREIVEERGLKQVTDTGAIEKARRRGHRGQPDKVEQANRAKPSMLGWFVGQVMKASGGKANPQAVNEISQKNDSHPAGLLGRAGLRDPAALRHGDGRRHVPSRDDPARARAEALERAYVQPSRRPKDGRYGENPNRLQHYYQFQVILKPSPADSRSSTSARSRRSASTALHDIRFVEDDWESPTLGAWGLGWEVWCDGMEVTQFTYFQQVGGIECDPVAVELTYGLERLAMYIQGVENVYDLPFNGDGVTYGDVFLQNERNIRHNFEHADTDMLFRISPRREGVPRLLAEEARAAGLRPVHQGQPHLQPARCARRDQRDRAPPISAACAHARQGLLRSLATRGGA
jgi:hypothetical protein